MSCNTIRVADSSIRQAAEITMMLYGDDAFAVVGQAMAEQNKPEQQAAWRSVSIVLHELMAERSDYPATTVQ